MDPPLRERLRWRNATDNDVERPATRANMARTAALLTAAGRARLPHRACWFPATVSSTTTSCSPRPRPRGSWASRSCSRTTACRSGGSTSSRVLDTALSTAAAYGWGSMSAYGPLPYVWVTRLRLLLLQPLGGARPPRAHRRRRTRSRSWLESPAENPLDGWIATVATLLVTGLSPVRSSATGSRT